jgi:hypothetical protein
MLQVPLVYPTSKMAVTAAYTATYEAYHGFLVKQVFLSSFDAAPSTYEILNHMIPFKLVNELVDVYSKNTGNKNGTCFTHPDQNLIRRMDMSSRNPFELIGSHFLSEWMKLERFLKQCNGIHCESSALRNGLLVPKKDCSVINLKCDNLFEMPNYHNSIGFSEESLSATKIEEEIALFNCAMQPILNELDSLIHRLGINDPTKC